MSAEEVVPVVLAVTDDIEDAQNPPEAAAAATPEPTLSTGSSVSPEPAPLDDNTGGLDGEGESAETNTSNRILSTSAGTHLGAFGAVEWLLFWSVGTIWGSSFLFMDIGLDAFSPGLITWLRVGSGAAVLALVPAARKPIDKADWSRLMALSVLWVGVPFTLFPIAQQWISSAVAGMLNGAVPIFVATIASCMLRKLPRGAQLGGLLLGFLGVVLVSLPSMGEGETEAAGVMLVLLATLCYGVSVNIAAPINQKYGSLPVMARMLALASVWTTPYGVVGLLDSTFKWPSMLAVSAAGVLGTGLAFVIMGTLVGRVGSTRASFITYVIPVVSLALGVVFKDDQVEIVALVGVVMIIVGAFLASRKES